MPSPFDLMSYLRALKHRWKRIGAAVTIAAALALAVSLLLPKEYEATVLLVIQPAATSAPYPAAMNPVYLEYLHSYEQFVQSDGLLARLLAESGLDRPPYEYSVRKFRSSALRAAVLKNTKILQVSVSLPDAQKAHDVALLLARLVSQSNTDINSFEAEQARQKIQKELQEARNRLEAARSVLEKFRRESREDEMSRQVAEEIEHRVSDEQQLQELEVNLAEKQARLATLSAQLAQQPEKFKLEERGQPSEVLNPLGQDLRKQLETARTDVEGLRARQKAMRAAVSEEEARLARSQAVLATVEMRRHDLEREFDLAQNGVVTFTNRANDSALAVSMGREELHIADPGIVPSRPSSPHTLLNVLLAAFLALLGSLFYETWVWNATEEDRALAALTHSRL